MLPLSRKSVAGRYAELRITTASKPRSIAMLHEKAVLLLSITRKESEVEKRRRILDQAQNILSQLSSALIVRDTVSQSLLYLYEYCYDLLERDDSEQIARARELLVILRDTFMYCLRSL